MQNSFEKMYIDEKSIKINNNKIPDTDRGCLARVIFNSIPILRFHSRKLNIIKENGEIIVDISELALKTNKNLYKNLIFNMNNGTIISNEENEKRLLTAEEIFHIIYLINKSYQITFPEYLFMY